MDSGYIIQLSITAGLSLLVIGWVNKSLSQSQVIASNGRLTFSMPRLYYLVSLGLLALAVIFLILPFTEEMKLQTPWLIFVLLIGCFTGVGAFRTYLLARYHEIEVDGNKLTVRSSFKRTKSFVLDAIEDMKFEGLTSSYRVKTGDGVFRFHQHLKGSRQLIELLSKDSKSQT